MDDGLDALVHGLDVVDVVDVPLDDVDGLFARGDDRHARVDVVDDVRALHKTLRMDMQLLFIDALCYACDAARL